MFHEMWDDPQTSKEGYVVYSCLFIHQGNWGCFSPKVGSMTYFNRQYEDSINGRFSRKNCDRNDQQNGAILVGGLEHVYFPIDWEQSSQLTNMFQRV